MRLSRKKFFNFFTVFGIKFTFIWVRIPKFKKYCSYPYFCDSKCCYNYLEFASGTVSCKRGFLRKSFATFSRSSALSSPSFEWGFLNLKVNCSYANLYNLKSCFNYLGFTSEAESSTSGSPIFEWEFLNLKSMCL